MSAPFYHGSAARPLARLSGRCAPLTGRTGPRPRRALGALRVPPVHPPLLRHLPRVAEREGTGGDGLGDDRAGRDVGAVADLDRRDEDRIGADEGSGADPGGVLPLAVVVAGDRPGADVRAGADEGVAEVSEVVRLRALAEHGLLGLDEVPDVGLLADLAAGPHARERAEDRARPDRRLLPDRVRTDGHARCEHRVAQDDACPDVARRADPRAAEQAGARLDDRVGTDLDPLVAVEPLGILDRHAGAHERAGAAPEEDL